MIYANLTDVSRCVLATVKSVAELYDFALLHLSDLTEEEARSVDLIYRDTTRYTDLMLKHINAVAKVDLVGK